MVRGIRRAQLAVVVGAPARRSPTRPAHEKNAPAEIDTAFVIPTRAGTAAETVELFPICPREFAPQQNSDPEAIVAHAWLMPPAMDTALTNPGTTLGLGENGSAPPSPS